MVASALNMLAIPLVPNLGASLLSSMKPTRKHVGLHCHVCIQLDHQRKFRNFRNTKSDVAHMRRVALLCVWVRHGLAAGSHGFGKLPNGHQNL